METLSFFDLLQIEEVQTKTELTLCDFEKFSFNDWKTKSKRLGKENSKEVCMFYNLEYNTYNPPYYHCLPQYNTDNSHRYLVLSVDGDCVFVCFKVIQIMNTKKIKVYDKPISLSKNYSNEKKVITTLKGIDFVFFLQKQKYCDANNFDFSFADYDYFLDRNTSCEKFTTKYKTKNLFNRFLSKSFRIEFSNNLNTNGVEELRNKWQDEKEKNNEVITTTTSKYIKRLLKWDKDCFYFNMWFNDELVLQWVFFVFDNALINIYRTSLSRCKKQSNSSWEKNTFDKIDKFAIYWIFTNTKFDRIYYAGAHPNHKKLLEHKEIHSDGKIIYCKSRNN